ncbi:hypothetical protein FNAPI_477 [Fusarium napiforme]|uniref:Uncharacterized protein n=1 Tax=Fusarium napiforme TaxID=42672 RepID=A0A8H5K8J4_9HYPO|nr:hypothetical protein FNAPI_477 [Fusarium napiforme]
MAGQEPLRQFRDVKDAVYRYDAVFAAIKSPTEIYEDKLRSIQDRIAQIWSELPSAPPDQMSRLQENLIELGGQKKELEIDQKNNIEHYERIHAHKIRQTMDSFRDHLFQLMGPSSGQSQFQMTPDTTRLGTDRVESAPVEPMFPEPAPIVPVSADDEMDDGPMFDDSLMDDTIDDTMEDGADHEPAHGILPQEDSVMQEPVETEPHNEEPIEEPPTENPTADEPFEVVPTNGEPAEEETAENETVEEPAEEETMETVPANREAGADSTVEPDADQTAEAEAEAEAEVVEREPVDDKPIASRTRKPGNRIKTSSRATAAREDISARQARYTFSPSPTPAAETITVQADESDDESDDEEEVEGEDEEEDENEDEDEDESSEAEDEVSEAEFSEPEEAPPSPRQTRSGGIKRKGNFSSPVPKTKRQKSERASSTNKETQKDTSTSESTRRQTRLSQRHQDQTSTDEFKGITDPKCGKVYLTYWDKTKEWLAVLILPMGSFDKIGIPGSIETCGLADTLPPCYQYDKVSGEYKWAKSYETGNRLVNERMFPVMYFDGRDFPNRSAIDWIDAKDLRRFNPKLNNDLLPHIKEVDRYIKADPARTALQEDDEDGEGVPHKERTVSQAPEPEEAKSKKRKGKSSGNKTSKSSKAKTNSKKQASATDAPTEAPTDTAPDTEVPKVIPTPEQMAAHRAAALKPQVLRMIGHHNTSGISKPNQAATSKPATPAPAKSNEKDSNGRPASKPSSHKPAGPKQSSSKPGAANPTRPAGKGPNQQAPSAQRSSGSKTPTASHPRPKPARPAEKESNQPAPKPSAAKPATARPAEKNASQPTPKPPVVRAASKPAEKESNQTAPGPSAPRPAENRQTNQVQTRAKPTGPRPTVTRAASGTPAEKEPSQPVSKPAAPKPTAPRPAEKESNPPPPKPTEQRPNKPTQTKPQAPVTAEPGVPPPVSDEIQTEFDTAFEPQDDEPAPILEDDSYAAPIQQPTAAVQQPAAPVQQPAAPIPQPAAPARQQATPVQQQVSQPSVDPPPPPPVPRAPSAPPRHQSVPHPSNVSRPLPIPSPVPRPASTRNPPRPLPGDDVKEEKKPIIVIDISDDDSDAENNAAAARTLSRQASRAQVIQQLTAALAADLSDSQQRTTAAPRTDADRLTAVDIALAALRRDEPSNTSAGQAWDRRSYDATHRPVQGDVERAHAAIYTPAVTNTPLPDQHQAQVANPNRNFGRQLGSGSLPTPPTQPLPGPMEIDNYASRPPYSAGPSPISQAYRQPPPEQYAHLQQPQPRQAQAPQQQLLTDYTSAAPSQPETSSRRGSYDQTARIPEPPPTTQYWHTQGRLQQTGDPQQSHQNQYQPSQSHASPMSTTSSIHYPRLDSQQQYPSQQAAPSQYQNAQYQAQQSPAQSYNQSPQAYQQQPVVQYQQPQPAQQYHAAPQPAPTQQYDTQAQIPPVGRPTQRTPSLAHLMHRHMHESPHSNRNQVLPPPPQASPPIPSAQTHNQTSPTSRPSFTSPYAAPVTQPPPQAGQLPNVPTVPSQQTAPLRTSHEWPTAYQNNQVQAQQGGASAERPSSSHYQSAPSSHSRSPSGHRQNEQRPPYQPATHSASQSYSSPHWNQPSSSQVSNLPPPRHLADIDPQLQDPNLLPPLVSSNRPQERPYQSSYNPYSAIASSPQRHEPSTAGVHPPQLPQPRQGGAGSPPGFSQQPQQPTPGAAYHPAPLRQVEPTAGPGPSAIQSVASPHEQRALPPRPESSAPAASQPSAPPASNQQAEAESRSSRDKCDKLNSEPGNTQQSESASTEANKFHPYVQVDLNLPQDPPDWGDSMPFELVEFISEWERLRSLRQGLAGLRNHKGGLECLFCNGPERVPYVYDRKNYFEKHLLHHWQRVKKLHPEGPDPTPRPVQRQQQYVFRDGTANLNI